MKVRLQKLLADAGVASRRASEQLILDGKVAVNGEVIRLLGSKADADTDRVTVEGRPIRARARRYVALNKPSGIICSRRDERDRKVVGSLLPKEWDDLYPVGRLDRDSEGLLLLTNDGEFCLRLTHPRFGILKCYIVTVAGKLDHSILRRMTAGISSQGEELKAHSARLISANASHSMAEIELAEGRNREVRRMFEVAGFTVVRLVRIKIGPLPLGELPTGRWRVLTAAEVRALLQPPTAKERPVDRPAGVDRHHPKPSTP